MSIIKSGVIFCQIQIKRKFGNDQSYVLIKYTNTYVHDIMDGILFRYSLEYIIIWNIGRLKVGLLQKS